MAGMNAHAANVSYLIDSGTSATFSGTPESISGGFSFDASTDTESAVDIILTGPDPFAIIS
jgi:hypothetical protein